MTLFPWGISSSPTAFAQGGSVNLLQNPGFETGNLSPWARWTLNPNDPGIVTIESSHIHSGTRNARIQPEGKEVVIYQTVSVIPGQKHFLSAWVSTNGMTAYLRWWSNATGVPQVCDQSSTVWPAYDYLSCELTVPAGTTNFNVQLSGTAPSGKWAVTDDWFLAVASPATTSRYMQTTDATTLYNLGCSRGTAGQSGVIVMWGDF